jgi:transcription elongation GreA/GreB family factor
MEKSLILREIIRHIEGDLRVMTDAALSAHAAATDKDNQGEGKYDMRAVEASYLAGAQSKRAAELQGVIQQYRQMPLPSFNQEASSAVSALLELESEGRTLYYFLVEREGGFTLKIDGQEVQILSIQSPLGAALVGRQVGEDFEVLMGNGRRREFAVLSLR